VSTKKTEPEPPKTVTVAEPDEAERQLAEDSGSQWEFIDRVPTMEEVKALLETLPPWWGVRPVDFLDYIQALPNTKKMKVWQEKDGRRLKVDQYFDVFTVYFSVAGRLQMLRAAQELNGWRVDFVPEPAPYKDNPAGFLEPMNGERLVYREYCEIWVPLTSRSLQRNAGEPVTAPLAPDTGKMAWFEDQKFSRLGRRPGTAWVPRKGGNQAAGSNPYEKVETSARGRAISAWGFGVLPGSGVASVEEMMGVPFNRATLAAEGKTEEAPAPKFDRQAVISEIMTFSEDIAQRSGQNSGEKLDRIAQFGKKQLHVNMVVSADPETGLPDELDWTKVKDGQLQLMRNSVKNKLAELIASTTNQKVESP
jgi:hypothetical protein